MFQFLYFSWTLEHILIRLAAKIPTTPPKALVTKVHLCPKVNLTFFVSFFPPLDSSVKIKHPLLPPLEILFLSLTSSPYFFVYIPTSLEVPSEFCL